MLTEKIKEQIIIRIESGINRKKEPEWIEDDVSRFIASTYNFDEDDAVRFAKKYVMIYFAAMEKKGTYPYR